MAERPQPCGFEPDFEHTCKPTSTEDFVHAEVSASSIEARESHGAHAPLASAKIHGGYVQHDAVASGRSDSQLSDIAVSDAGSLVLAFESLCIVIKFMVGTNTGASTENL